MSLSKLGLSIEILKSVTMFEKAKHAEATLDAAMDVLIEQAAEIEHLTSCVNFLQKTIEVNNGASDQA